MYLTLRFKQITYFNITCDNIVYFRQCPLLPYFKVIAQHCIVRICGMITKNQHLAKFVLHSIMLTEKYLVYLSGIVPVRCMQTTISVTLKQL